MREDQNKYQDENVKCAQEPTISQLLNAIDSEITEISYARNEISNFGHRLSNTNVPIPEGKSTERPPSQDMAQRLELTLERVRNLRQSLYELSSKFNSLI